MMPTMEGEATVSELRDHAGRILRRVAAGESVAITRRGKRVAMLTPLAASYAAADDAVDWSHSAAARSFPAHLRRPTAKQSAQLRLEAAGRW